jgi:hypothetical protein
MAAGHTVGVCSHGNASMTGQWRRTKMASKKSIAAAIEAKVQTYSYWRIGLTHNLSERKAYWKDTKNQDVTYWTAWEADSLSDAQDIEAYFINKGMKGGTGGDLSHIRTVYVYIF